MFSFFILLCGLYLGQEYNLPRIKVVCEAIGEYIQSLYNQNTNTIKSFGKFW